MTDDELSPQEDERVRALLADLGGETLPPVVAARLDATLADLVAERAPDEPWEPGEHGEPTEARVVPLRARWLPAAAAAAVAMVVLGGVGVLTGTFATLAGNDTTSAKSADSGAAGSSADQAPSAAASDSSGSGGSGTEKAVPGTVADGSPQLSAATFSADATRLLGQRRDLYSAPQDDGAATSLRTPPPGCPGPQLADDAVTTPIVLDGAPALLVVHPARAGTRLVEAWSCSGDTRLASTRVSP